MPKKRFFVAVVGLHGLLLGCGSSPEDLHAERAAPPPDDTKLIGDISGRGGESCVDQVAEAEPLPFDLYVLFDQSGSMSTPAGDGNRLDAVRAAMSDFLRDESSAGMGLGIGYFGNNPLGEASCNPTDYQMPAVAIGQLPENASAVTASLAAVKPTGETPTGAALRGTCTYAKAWREAHPGRELDVLLLTDGIPEAPISRANGCDPTLDDAIVATEACVDQANVKVFVLGVGPNLTNLNRIAAAGGTDHAFLVDGGDVTRNVSDALGRIRGSALPCSFVLPPPPEGQSFEYDQVNVVVTDTAGDDHALYNVPSAAECTDDGGWFYATDAAGGEPQRVELCAASCTYTKAQSDGGRLRFALGCSTLTTTR